MQRLVTNLMLEQDSDDVAEDLSQQPVRQMPEVPPGPHPLYGVPPGELAEDGIDPVAHAAQIGAPFGVGIALLGPVGREEL